MSEFKKMWDDIDVAFMRDIEVFPVEMTAGIDDAVKAFSEKVVIIPEEHIVQLTLLGWQDEERTKLYNEYMMPFVSLEAAKFIAEKLGELNE